MRQTLLVALRDYRQVTATRGFWILLLVFPLAIAASITATRFIVPNAKAAYAIIDPSGQYKQLIQRQVEVDYQGLVLEGLGRHAERWKSKPLRGPASWSASQPYASDRQIEAFMAAGGLSPALRQLRPSLAADAPPFSAPSRHFALATLPKSVEDKAPSQIAPAVATYLHRDIATAHGTRPLALVVYIPKDFGAAPARIWVSGAAAGGLIDTIQSVLTRALRTQILVASNVPADSVARAERLEAPLVVSESGSHDRNDVFIHSAATLGAVYLLLLASIITGSMMLQGVIEERSNRLLEAVLACVRPSQLMCGKLLGLGAVGLSVVAVWLLCGLSVALMVPGVIADYVRPSLLALNHPWMIFAIVFYFLSGFLIVAACFLAIGSVSESMQDAQAYLTPMMMVIMLPVVLMMSATIANPDSLFVRVMSWIPLYTPFAMLARLGNGVSVYELLGTGALLIVFLALQLLALGRIFEANILNTGQRPRLATLARSILASKT